LNVFLTADPDNRPAFGMSRTTQGNHMRHVAVHPPPDSFTTDDVTTLPELLRWRCHRSPEREAYRQCEAGVWRRYSWREVEGLVARWQVALAGENLAS
jgi:hypothetical protein